MEKRTTPRAARRALAPRCGAVLKLPAPAVALAILVAALGAGKPASAQIPSPTQVQQLIRQNSGLIRQRIQQYGLTQDQIRQRLQAAGLSPNLLDQFMDSTLTGPTQVSAETMRALDLLGLWNVQAEGLEQVQVDTGLVVPRGVLPEGETGALRLFGLDLFRGRTTLFQPILSGPVPPSYRLGPGDLLVLVLTGDVELVHELAVSREGSVLIPQVGQLFVSSLTMEQLGSLLRERLGRAYSGIRTGTTRFDVTIARLRTNQVYVVGEVTQPGAYQLASVATVLNAIYAAGGLTERANFREITVRRRGEVVSTLDLYDYLLRGDSKRDVILEQGDVVFVPLRGIRASISGAVTRPAVYEIQPRETLEDLIRTAGGFRPDADLKRIAVHRLVPAADRAPGPVPRAVVDVALKAPAASHDGAADGTRDPVRGMAVPPLGLLDGDSVVVDSVTEPAVSLTVSVVGMVRKAGSYPWREGMTLRDLVMLARGPLVGADLREAELARLPQERTGGQLAQVLRVPLDSSYLFERETGGQYLGAAGLPFPPAGSAPEVTLEPYDQVTIFRQPQFELQQPVHVTGEVRTPGTYALTRKGERLSELLKRREACYPPPTPRVRGSTAAGRASAEWTWTCGGRWNGRRARPT